ncbi:glucoamylase family protein [Sphingomonas sp. CFBP8993]|uniref:glucoamylase family protein n=1 Tax=Sphingomonas sp. CFBP8993 TaxID=3096526 RepID=UPI002A6B26CE|nr:glucoamylase family protein [Sphingomonas sp. CFBP8993]MDY0960346.1 glucoamylase family protein [Sphingomonas sp. CFBP8993]
MYDRRRVLNLGGLSLAALMTGCAGPPHGRIAAPRIIPQVQPDLIRDLQERSFRFFWETTDADTGLAPDRWPTPSFASIAAVGFALTAYPVGVVNGWITREEARARTLTTLTFFADAPQGPGETGFSGYKGFFYHFLGVTKGQRFARCELSTIDTALLLGGMLFAQSWFDGDHPDEVRIRALVDQVYGAVDWTWITPRAPFVSMGWHPESGFIKADWDSYNEGMLLYLLALGSPTHPLPQGTWQSWTRRFEPSWGDRWGEPHLQFAPLFGHQYSHVWVDFKGIRDDYMATKGIDYFENSRRATYAQQRYAMANPGRWAGYGAEVWGLTACDGPGDFTQQIDGVRREFFSYSARGPGERDDGTLAPTAAAGSIAFAPDIVMPAVKAMHDRYGVGIYGKYGFLDAFNPTLTNAAEPLKHGEIVAGIGWVDKDYLGIDQGPIVAMIENHRTGLIWKTMRRNPHLRRGLQRAGFTGGWLNG